MSLLSASVLFKQALNVFYFVLVELNLVIFEMVCVTDFFCSQCRPLKL